jgi:hypothetical protein
MNHPKCPKCNEDPILFEDKIVGGWYYIIHTNKICKNCSQPLALDLKSVSIYTTISIVGFASIIPVSIYLWRFGEIIDPLIPNINLGMAIFFLCWVIYIFSLNFTVPYFYGKLCGRNFLRCKES